MASSKLCSGPDRRVAPAPAASNTGVLPLDAVYEILLRLPAKEICRLRTVCRPWRGLLSDPQFATAHAARHPGPLIIASYRFNGDHDNLVDIMDLSGHSVKKVRMNDGDWARRITLDLVHVKNVRSTRCRLLNPATGAVYHLSNRLAEEHVRFQLDPLDYIDPLYLFGQIACTGEYKVLRRLSRYSDRQLHHLFEVCTLNGSSHTMWRGKQAPHHSVANDNWTATVIDGIVYFLCLGGHHGLVFVNKCFEKDLIITFDLEEEAWGPNIRGPHISFPNNAFQVYQDLGLPILKQLTLANLNGSLAIVHGPVPNMNIWILMDSGTGVWIKQYSMKVEQYDMVSYVHPLSILDDGRIVIHIEGKGLQIYDPRRSTFTNVVEMEHCSGISMYTGNLLSLE